MRFAILALWICCAWAQVKLERYPQKFVTIHQTGTAEAPPEVRSGAVLRVRASDGAQWEGSATGLVRTDEKAKWPLDRRQYFRGRRYLPDDRVEHIAPDSRGGVWVRTPGGISHIEFRPMTLEEKAAYFEKRVQERHDRYGMVADSNLRTPGDLSTNLPFTNDNDGLWTAMYAAAKCFEYQVTKSAEALERAKKAVNAVLYLEEVTGRPGYPARSYIKAGETRGNDGVWYWTPDRKIEWKSDTSSDEIVGHFYIFAIAHDLLPDPELKKRIAATARRVMDHIIGNGYYLIDVTGKPTRWGRWSLDYFASQVGHPDSPLNSLELLTFLLTTHHLTGDAKYMTEYRKVAFDLKYADIMKTLNERRRVINYSDEELALLPFYLAFRYEKDAAMLGHYRAALEQWWTNIQREHNPLWNLIYQTANPKARVDLASSVHTLYRIPIDLRNWATDNSHRTDLDWEPNPDRFGRKQTKTFIAPDERPVMKWNGNPFRVNGGGNGGSEDDGAFFLLPYWMGRYHGLLKGR